MKVNPGSAVGPQIAMTPLGVEHLDKQKAEREAPARNRKSP